MSAMSWLYSKKEDKIQSSSQRMLEEFDVLFARYRQVLLPVAHCVLGNHKEAEEAVQNCQSAASCNLARFKNEGAFRSWLVRVLIDEALAIQFKKRQQGVRRISLCE